MIIAFVSLTSSAISYFFAKAKVFLFSLLVFYICNFFLSYGIFYNSHPTLFIALITLFLVFPVGCLITFTLDKYWALFCTDTSFIFVIVWLLIPVFFVINLISYIVKAIHA